MTESLKLHRGPRLFREITLTVGAILGLLCVLAALVGVFFGITPVIFRSGSMAPAIDTGALALVQQVPATRLQLGDVVSVQNADQERVTHRVVGIQGMSNGEMLLTLKGDANPQPDVQTYQLSKADRVFFSVPILGYLLAWLQSPWAIFLGGLLVGVLLMLAFRPGSRGRNASPESAEATIGTTTVSAATVGAAKPPRRRRGLFTAVTLLGLSGGLVFAGAQSTMAVFQDTSVATSGTFTGASLPQPLPNPPDCVASGVPSSATVSWNSTAALPAGAQFRIRYSGIINGTVMVGTGHSYAFDGALLGGLGLSSGRLTVLVDSVITGTNWVSPVSTRTIGYSITLVIKSFTC
ncbi:signal peptidase I [Psychromicrobium silvestre]|uniref:Signal peptidase I n=1 Tax=Psychromicrobium silvestre TaxID=1645614 RepID=A0A7Y9LVZ5_9MICC|nr:signal peptidase I [Psychromicrobium silvestre]NYE96581.1 signal peptidase I [Psychromicrobium silvestre]